MDLSINSYYMVKYLSTRYNKILDLRVHGVVPINTWRLGKISRARGTLCAKDLFRVNIKWKVYIKWYEYRYMGMVTRTCAKNGSGKGHAYLVTRTRGVSLYIAHAVFRTLHENHVPCRNAVALSLHFTRSLPITSLLLIPLTPGALSHLLPP